MMLHAWKSSLTIVVLVLLAVVLTACGSSDESLPPGVRSIDQILNGEIEIVELTSSSALVQVETDIDVVCSVVYGEDDQYGRQSTDLAMGGLGHSQHNAALRGLQPDTVYHYRLQGTGPDGTFYRSEDLTFRTPAEEDGSPDLGQNVANRDVGARVIEASSTFGRDWESDNAIDGDPTTEWATASDGDSAFIAVELAAPTDLTGVGFWTRTMGATGEINRFQVITDDGTVLGPFDLPNANRLYVFPVSANAGVLRFEAVTSSGSNTGAVEVAAFARE